MKTPLHQSEEKNCMMLSQNNEGRHIGLPLRKSSYFFDLITPSPLKGEGEDEGDNFYYSALSYQCSLF